MTSNRWNLLRRVFPCGVLMFLTSVATVTSAQSIDAVTDDENRTEGIVAPGGIALVRGPMLRIPESTCPIPNDAWPLSAPDCGVTVLLNDEPIPIGRITGSPEYSFLKVQIPYEDSAGEKVALGPGEVKVQVDGVTTDPFPVEIRKYHPTIIVSSDTPPLDDLPFGSFLRIRDGRNMEVAPQDPAQPGEVLTVTLDGIGPSIPFVPAGSAGPSDPLAVPAVTPTLLIQREGKGIQEAQLLSATLDEYRVGLYKIQFVVPRDLPPAVDYEFIVQMEDGGEVFPSEPVALSIGDIDYQITAVLDAAGYEDLISPGSLVSVFGLFADKEIVADSVPLRLEEEGLSITFDGIPAGILSVSQRPTFDQANVHVPWNIDVTDGEVDVQIQVNQKGITTGETFSVPAAAASPGIYTFDPAKGNAIIQNVSLGNDDVINGSFAHAEGSLGTVYGEQPAPVGGIITIWANGLGPVNGVVGTGDVPGLESPLLIPEKQVTVKVGGIPATIIGTPVLHPTLVGTFQINAQIPEQLIPNPLTIVQLEVDCDGTILKSRFGTYIATRAKP